MNFSAFFTDGAVLQRNKPIKIRGEGEGSAKLTFNGECVDIIADNGIWNAVLPPMPAGGPYEMKLISETGETVISDIMIGEVFLAGGQSNMEQPTFATLGGFEKTQNYDNSMIRFLTVPRRTAKDRICHNWNFECTYSEDTPWEKCNENSALHFSAIGFYFAKLLQEKLGVAVGIISCNWGGTRIQTWLSEESIKDKSEFSYIFDELSERPVDYEDRYKEFRNWAENTLVLTDALEECRKMGAYNFARHNFFEWMAEPFGEKCINWPGVLYRNMISRIAPYTINGVLWYQGESNSYHPDGYSDLFGILRQNWFRLWNDEFAFYTVQIAPFMHYGAGEKWAQIIEEQIKATRKFNDVYAVTTTDIGEKDNIHPIDKYKVAEKLFGAVMTHSFGEKTDYSGPVFTSYKIEDNAVSLEFEYADGLYFDGDVKEIKVIGENGEIFDYTVEIKNDKLIVSSEKKITEIRLGFYAWSKINLKNSAGFTAAPFRCLLK